MRHRGRCDPQGQLLAHVGGHPLPQLRQWHPKEVSQRFHPRGDPQGVGDRSAVVGKSAGRVGLPIGPACDRITQILKPAGVELGLVSLQAREALPHVAVRLGIGRHIINMAVRDMHFATGMPDSMLRVLLLGHITTLNSLNALQYCSAAPLSARRDWPHGMNPT